MLEREKRQSNIAAGIWFICLIFLTATVNKGAGGNIWENDMYISQAAVWIMIVSWFYALWAYAKAKGRSGLWAIAGVFTLLGLIVLLLLKDKHEADA